MDENIEAIESGYEFLLAYAAQGKEADQGGSDAPSEVRRILGSMSSAAAATITELEASDNDFHAVVVDDAAQGKSRHRPGAGAGRHQLGNGR